jgi:RNA polymerase nonessential primary-like sigma factor
MQAGRLGVCRAVETYDPEKGAWSTYATPWIRQSIHRLLDNEDKTVRQPSHVQETALRVRRAEAALCQQLDGRQPSAESVARAAGVSEKKVKISLAESALGALSLDSRGPDFDKTLGDSIASDHDSPADAEYTARRKRIVERLMGMLSEREQRVLRGRLWDERSLIELANGEGVSRERVRQIEEMSIQKLRTMARRLRVSAA